MSPLEIVALGILAAGVVGYGVSLTLLWLFRRWMGDRGQGWPRTLLGAMLLRECLLASLYLTSLVSTLGLLRGGVRLAVNFAAGIALMLAPWALAWALWRWWPHGAGAPRWWRRGGDD